MKRYTIILLILAVVLFCPNTIRAVSDPLLFPVPPQIQFSFGPLVNQPEVVPGVPAQILLKVMNHSEYEAQVRLALTPFQISMSDGQISFLPQTQLPVLDYIHITGEQRTLFPGESQLVPVEINLPNGFEAGDQYIAVMAEFAPNIPPNSTAGSSALGQIASLILFHTGDHIDRSAQIESLIAPSFVWRGPIAAKLTIANRGNTHFFVVGGYSLKNLITRRLDGFTLPTNIITAGSGRTLNLFIYKAYPFGLYRLTVNILDGNEKRHSAQLYIWAIPMIPVCIVVIALLLLWLFFSRYSLRKIPIDKV